MHKMAGIVRYSLMAVLFVVLAACSEILRDHGYVPTKEDLATIQVGTDTKDSVVAAIGQPTAAGILDVSGWYYVQSRFRHFAYKEPREIDRQVVAISFDSRGKVANIERFGLERGRVVTLSRRVTASSVRDTVFLRQLLGNLGRLDAGQLFGG